MFNATTQVDTSTPIPAHISKSQVLSFLHDTTKILSLNPLVSECKTMPAESVIAFYKSVPAENKPADPASCKLFAITEDADARQASSGSWTKKFVPDEVKYETGFESTPAGMITITHAPLGVSSVTSWVIRDEPAGSGSGNGAGGLVVEMTGKVQSNAVLMQLIKRMLPRDYQELAGRFLEELKKDVGDGEGVGEAEVVEKV